MPDAEHLLNKVESRLPDLRTLAHVSIFLAAMAVTACKDSSVADPLTPDPVVSCEDPVSGEADIGSVINAADIRWEQLTEDAGENTRGVRQSMMGIPLNQEALLCDTVKISLETPVINPATGSDEFHPVAVLSSGCPARSWSWCWQALSARTRS